MSGTFAQYLGSLAGGGGGGGGGGGVTTLANFGSSPNAKGGAISGSTLTLDPADATHPGGVSTTTQSFLGAKTFLTSIAATKMVSTLIDDSNYLVASGDNTKKVGWNANGIGTGSRVFLDFSNSGSDISIIFPDFSSTIATTSALSSYALLAGAGTQVLSGSLFDDSNALVASGDHTKKVTWNCNGITAGQAVNLLFSDTGSGATLTMPSATTNIPGSTSVSVSTAAVWNGSGFLTSSLTTGTELGYVHGVTSAIQTQINALAPTASPTFTGTVTAANIIDSGLSTNTAVYANGSSELTSSSTTATELGYLHGVQSSLANTEYSDTVTTGAVTVDAANGPAHSLTVVANTTFTLNNFQAGGSYVIRIIQGGSGGYTYTWPGGMKWSGGTAPVGSAVAGKDDLINIYAISSTSFLGSYSLNY